MPLISIRGLRTLGFDNLDLDIPKQALTLVVGGSGSGKTALLRGVLAAESQRRVKAGDKSEAFLPRNNINCARDLDSLTGLTFTLDVMSLISDLPARLSLGDYSGCSSLLSDLAFYEGRPICRVCRALMLPSSRESTLTEVTTCFMRKAGEVPSDMLAKKSSLLVGRLLYRPLKTSDAGNSGLEDALMQVFSFWAEGGRRIVVGKTLIVLPVQKTLNADAYEMSGDQDWESLRSELEAAWENSADGEQMIVSSVERSSSVGEEKSARTVLDEFVAETGEDVVVLHLCSAIGIPEGDKDESPYKVAKTWFVCDGWLCPECGSFFSSGDFKDFVYRDPAALEEVFLGDRSLGCIHSAKINEIASMLSDSGAVESPSGECGLKSAGFRAVLEEKLRVFASLGLSTLSLSTTLGMLSEEQRLLAFLAKWRMDSVGDCLFVVDAPSAVLHPKDLLLMFAALKGLVSQGNTVLVSSSEEPAGAGADWLIKLRREQGSNQDDPRHALVCSYQGPPRAVEADDGRAALVLGRTKEKIIGEAKLGRSSTVGLDLSTFFPNAVRGQVLVPYGSVVSIIGRAGSGKSCLLSALADRAGQRDKAVVFKGLDYFKKAYHLTAKGVSEGKRIFDYAGIGVQVANLYSSLPEARRAGLSAKDFKYGQGKTSCPVCGGRGYVDGQEGGSGEAPISCGACAGLGFSQFAAEARYLNLSFRDALTLPVQRLIPAFGARRSIIEKLSLFTEAGLGHLTLGSYVECMPQGAQMVLLLLDLMSKPLTNRSLVLLNRPFGHLNAIEIDQPLGCFLRLARESMSTFLLVTQRPEVVCRADFTLEIGQGAELLFWG